MSASSPLSCFYVGDWEILDENLRELINFHCFSLIALLIGIACIPRRENKSKERLRSRLISGLLLESDSLANQGLIPLAEAWFHLQSFVFASFHGIDYQKGSFLKLLQSIVKQWNALGKSKKHVCTVKIQEINRTIRAKREISTLYVGRSTIKYNKL